MRRIMFEIMLIPIALVVVSTVFMTLLAVKATDHVVWVFATIMVVLTLINLGNELHERKRRQ